MTTEGSRFLRRRAAWADAQLRAAGCPADIGAHYAGVSEALVRRAVRETPLRGDVTETVRRLVEAEIAAARRRS